MVPEIASDVHTAGHYMSSPSSPPHLMQVFSSCSSNHSLLVPENPSTSAPLLEPWHLLFLLLGDGLPSACSHILPIYMLICHLHLTCLLLLHLIHPPTDPQEFHPAYFSSGAFNMSLNILINRPRPFNRMQVS